MTCTATSLRGDIAIPDGIEIIQPVTDADFAGAVVAAIEANSEDPVAATPMASETAGRRALVTSGGTSVLARDGLSGEAVGSAVCPAPHDRVTKLASVAVRRAYRQRGVGTALAARLAQITLAGRADGLWLTPGASGDAPVAS